MLLPYIITPLAGALVGYATNDLAIRMLFRPHRAHYVCGRKLPFTPGLIPREKDRIAKALGESISQNLMSPEVLRDTLLSQKIMDKVAEVIERWIERMKSNDTPLRDVLCQYLNSDDLQKACEQGIDELAAMTAARLAEAHLGEKIAHIAVEHAMQKMKGGLAGLLHFDKFLFLLQDPAEQLLTRGIDQMLQDKAPEMAHQLISDGMDSFMSTPLSRLLEGKDDRLTQIRQYLLLLYRNTIEQQLPQMLATLDIAKVIEEQIQKMDALEFERIIMDIMHHELRAIVWVGALLGLLIGCINCLFI